MKMLKTTEYILQTYRRLVRYNETLISRLPHYDAEHHRHLAAEGYSKLIPKRYAPYTVMSVRPNYLKKLQ